MTAPNQEMCGQWFATSAQRLMVVMILCFGVTGLAHAAGVQSDPQDAESSGDVVDERVPAPVDPEPAVAEPAAPENEVTLSPQLLASRETLAAGKEDVPVLAIHATRLLDAGDVDTLADVLEGANPQSALGILQALQTSTSVALLSETLGLASAQEETEVSQLAMDNLVRLARERPEVTQQLIERLDVPGHVAARRRTMVIVLGRSRDLNAVEPLIELLGGPQGPDAGRALNELTGHSLGEDLEAWTEFWERSRGETRDVLLERSLAAERQARRVSEQQMREEVIQARIGSIGMDVDLLVAGLSDSYAAVRLASAQKLGSHSNGEQAATAIPTMLARLGYGTQGNGNGNGHANGHAAPMENDAQVRAALVAAVGVLGRGEPVVLEVLLHELSSDDEGIAAVAAAAFVRLRNHPEVVNPLLGYLERTPVEEVTQVTVLLVVASNEPSGVLDRLSVWLGPEHTPTVRAAAVAAVLASEELPRALEAVGHVVSEEEVRDVRYALAKALGDRARSLPEDDDARPQVLVLLGQLLEDVDSSVRAEAASSLGEAGGASAFVLLERRSRAEVDASVMMRILHALGQIGEREAVGAIGRVCASWSGEGSGELNDAAHRALLVLGDGVPADGWLEMAGTLKAVGSPALSAWSLREILLRHEGDPGSREVVSLARGHLAEVLCLNGQAREAYQMLVELHEAGAPYPGLRLRLELLARTAEELALIDEAADYYLERLDELAEGDATRIETQRGAVRTLVAAGRYEEALPLVREVYEQDASDNGTMYQLARVQLALGRDRAAVDTLRRLLPRIPVQEVELRAEIEALLAQVEPTLPAPAPAEPAEQPDPVAGDGTGDGTDPDTDTGAAGGTAEKPASGRSGSPSAEGAAETGETPPAVPEQGASSDDDSTDDTHQGTSST